MPDTKIDFGNNPIYTPASTAQRNVLRDAIGLPPATQQESEEGTETELRSFSPERIAQAIAALGGGGGIPETINVNTDADKRALTDLVVGQMVNITNEADRLEMYIGGTISNQSSWFVLKNTLELILNSFDVNGSVAITSSDIGLPASTAINAGVTHSVGWVSGGTSIRFDVTGAFAPPYLNDFLTSGGLKLTSLSFSSYPLYQMFDEFPDFSAGDSVMELVIPPTNFFAPRSFIEIGIINI